MSKKRSSPPTNSDIWFCQGYPEPGSGSDLASLKTKAEDKGDHYLVNGVKTGTNWPNTDWMFCLVRTSNEDIRQMGISFILIDMKTPSPCETDHHFGHTVRGLPRDQHGLL